KPVVTPGVANRTSDTAATVKFTSNEAGKYYIAVVAKDAGTPTLDTTGTGADCTTAEATASVTLTAGAKDVYVVVKDAAGNVSDAVKIAVAAYVAPDTTAPKITSFLVHDASSNGFGDELGDKLTIIFDEPMKDTDALLDATDLENLFTFSNGITDGTNFDNVVLSIAFKDSTTLEITITDLNSSYTTNAITTDSSEKVSFGSITANDLEDLAGNDLNGITGAPLILGTN
ncbi:MAG: hypothetical protein VB113_06445, partial [Acetobacterium wieringae]|nr:hypothetical protein [Acetobacterium wieringae]